jgi:tetratricopeptide (TPR) repeat protein
MVETLRGAGMTLYKFTPDIMAEGDLKQITVGREALLQDILARLKEHAIRKEPYYLLLIGPRGIGKSHLLLLVYYKINETRELRDIIETIKLSEEEYSVTTLSDVFCRILEQSDVDVPTSNEEAIIEKAVDYLNNLKLERMPLVLIDNLDLIFGQLSEDDRKRLRSILQEQNNMMIIGASPSVFGEVTKYEEPFYNFFEIRFLDDLSESEVEELVKKKLELEKKEAILKEFDKYRPKINAIAVLTGGNPRLIISLCDILCQPDTLISIEKTLLTLLDDLTPFYQARMETLTTQQRKIFDILATADGPLTPTDIAKLSRYDVNIVNVQLKRIEEMGFVESIKLRKKRNVHYEVKERLFRIWREMRFSLGRKRISLFVKFLKVWYSKEELVKEYFELMEPLGKTPQKAELEAAQLIEHLCYIQEAIGAPTKYNLIEMQILDILARSNLLVAEREKAVLIDLSKRDGRAKVLLHVLEAFIHNIREEYDEGLKSAAEAVRLEPKNPMANFAFGRLLISKNLFKESLTYMNYLSLSSGLLWKLIGLFFKSQLLLDMEQYENALSAVDQLIEEIDKNKPKSNTSLVLKAAWVLKGNILGGMNNIEAISCFDKALAINPEDNGVLYERAFAAAFFKQDDARKWLDEYRCRKPDDVDGLLLEGRILLNEEKYDEGIAVVKNCLDVAEERKDANGISRSAYLLNPLYNGLLLHYLEIGKIENAEAVFLSVLQLKAYRKDTFEDDLVKHFLSMLERKHFEFALQAANIVYEKLGKEDAGILFPMVIAVEYIITRKVDVFETVQKEVRQIAVSIIKKFSPETPIPSAIDQKQS